MLEIIDYDSNYSLQVDTLDEKYWGVCETEKASSEIKLNDIVKIALMNNVVVGLLHFKQIGDLIDCYHILVDDNYQNQKIATRLMVEALTEVDRRNVKTLVAHAVEHDGIVNARKLLEKFGFKEIYSVTNYWDSLYPNEYCKQCENNDCHCGVVVFLKNLNKIG